MIDLYELLGKLPNSLSHPSIKDVCIFHRGLICKLYFAFHYNFLFLLQTGSEILECMMEVEEFLRGQMEKYLPQVLYYRKTLTNGHA